MERGSRSEPRADKVAVVEEVEQRLSDSDVVLLTEYRGLDVDQLAELRGALIEAEAIYKIYKNSLVRRAADGKTPDEFMELLIGPTALAFTNDEPSRAAKALADFAAENDALIIKGGILSGAFIDAKQIKELAKLPARDEVLTQLAGGLSASVTALASLMQNLLGGVAGLFDALAAKLPPAPEPEPEPEPAASEPAATPEEPAAEADAEEPAAAAETQDETAAAADPAEKDAPSEEVAEPSEEPAEPAEAEAAAPKAEMQDEAPAEEPADPTEDAADPAEETAAETEAAAKPASDSDESSE